MREDSWYSRYKQIEKQRRKCRRKEAQSVRNNQMRVEMKGAARRGDHAKRRQANEKTKANDKDQRSCLVPHGVAVVVERGPDVERCRSDDGRLSHDDVSGRRLEVVKVSVQGRLGQERGRRLERRLEQGTTLGRDTSSVERLVASLVRHVVGDQRQMSVCEWCKRTRTVSLEFGGGSYIDEERGMTDS